MTPSLKILIPLLIISLVSFLFIVNAAIIQPEKLPVTLETKEQNKTIFYNVTNEVWNVTPQCTWVESNQSWQDCIRQINVTTKKSKSIVAKQWQEVIIPSGKNISLEGYNVWCYDSASTITCKSAWDGNPYLQKILPGESFFLITKSSYVLEPTGYLTKKYTPLKTEIV